jgi:predicted ATPase
VSGEAGTGKTRLTSEFLKIARQKDVTILTGWCLCNAAIPYFPFIEAFDSFFSEDAGKDISSQRAALKTWLVTPNQPNPYNQEVESVIAWKDQRFANVVNELLYFSTDKPLLLILEDLHWADSASLSLLHYLSRAIGSERILVLGTFRCEELNPAAESVENPLLNTLRLMGREDLFREIRLKNLGKSEVGKILESMLEGTVAEEFAGRLSEESSGNPLFVVELIRLLFESNSLAKESGVWKLTVDKLGIPSKVKEVILHRIATLKPNQRRTLDVASVIGDKFDPKLLGAVLSQDSLEVLETLNSVALSKSLVCVEGDYYCFDHAKSREILYEEILAPLKKGYHERVAEKIESFNEKRQSQLNDLAYHYTKAGNKSKSIQYNLEAGKDALARFSNSESITYFKYVVDAVGEDPENLGKKLVAMEGLGDAYLASTQFKKSAATFEALASLEGASRVRVLRKAMEASFFQNDIPHLAGLIEEAEKLEFSDRLERARLIMNKGRVLVMQDQQAAATELYEEALRIFQEEFSIWDTAWVSIAYGTNAQSLGRFEEALTVLLRSIRLFEELGDSRWLVEAYSMTGTMFAVYYGFAQEALEMFNKAEQLNEKAKLGDDLMLAQLNIGRGAAYTSMGDLKNALSASLAGLKYAEKIDSSWGKGMAYSALTNLSTVMGKISEAEEYHSKLMLLPAQTLSNPSVLANMSTALLLAGKKQWKESMLMFDEIFTRYKNSPNPSSEAIVRKTYAWTLLKQRHLLKAASQFRESQKYYKNIAARFAHTDLQTIVMASRPDSNGCFEARFDIINFSRAVGTLTKANLFSYSDFAVEYSPPELSVQNGTVIFGKRTVEPFSVVTIKLKLRAKKAGTLGFSTIVEYFDDRGKAKNFQAKPITVTVGVSQEKGDANQPLEAVIPAIEFRSEASRKVFDFLADCFREESVQRRIPQERAGWRTLMDVVREGKVSKYSIYGSMGSRGKAMLELERSGLVDVRVFAGERGRGGEILKVRVAYEKEFVRRYVDQNVR